MHNLAERDNRIVTEALRTTRTLEDIGKDYGVTKQRVQQILKKHRVDQKQRPNSTRSLVMAYRLGASLEDLARMSQSSEQLVRRRFRQAGIYLPRESRKLWTRERILEFARWWHAEFGSLATTDWRIHEAKKLGHVDRIERLRRYEAPSYARVCSEFGSWSEMIRVAGIQPSPRGGASHSRG